MNAAGDFELIGAPPTPKYDHRAHLNLWHAGRRRLKGGSAPFQFHEPMELHKGDSGIIVAT